jgi:RNA polymerase sigma factor (sigma-70 family)
MTTDAELLRRFAETHAEDAFAELVRRHVDLVYSAALRQVNGDAHLAQDIAQSVFTDLARKAASLSRRERLIGWLYTSVHFAAAKSVRSEQRRRAHEQEAHTMRELLHDSTPDLEWNKLIPVLDAAMNELKEIDREIILLRYFEDCRLAEVGAKFGLSENAARMRVERALEKLRAALIRHGVKTTASALSAAVIAHAVHAAPVGLAATLTAASLASVASTAASTFTVLKIMSMTKLQFGVAAILLVGATATVLLQRQTQNALRRENQSVHQQLSQLQTANENLSNQIARTTLTLSLPAPPIQASTTPPDTMPESHSTNLIMRLMRGEKAPLLTPQQAESYLTQNHRTAGSLLAAFRATGDRKLLDEAMEKYPADPQVAFTAAYASGASPEDQRRWLDAFKRSAPENALPNYLSAVGHFKAGQSDEAIQDLSAAFSKQRFQDYSWDFIQNGEEAYRAAGYPEVEARVIPSMALILPHLAELKQLNFNLIDLAAAYRQAGDESSAAAALQMDATLGQRLDATENSALITKLVGMTIESIALKQMDPNSPYGAAGQTAKDRLDEITQRKTSLSDFAKQLDGIYTTISASDWISYHDRWQAFGEENAMKWLLSKYPQH